MDGQSEQDLSGMEDEDRSRALEESAKDVEMVQREYIKMLDELRDTIARCLVEEKIIENFTDDHWRQLLNGLASHLEECIRLKEASDKFVAGSHTVILEQFQEYMHSY